jgi:hypothetical protein
MDSASGYGAAGRLGRQAIMMLAGGKITRLDAGLEEGLSYLIHQCRHLCMHCCRH